MHPSSRRLLVVSNRLPVVIDSSGDGQLTIQPASGGLVTAIKPVLQKRGGMWIGWVGTDLLDTAVLRSALNESSERAGYDLEPVLLDQDELEGYYYGFSNEVLWPLFHDMQSHANFEEAYWTAYRAVNRKFAGAVAAQSRPDDFVWVQDYHLMGVAEVLREQEVESTLAFFLHTPFPPADIFVKLPWRDKLLRALLQYDVIGFQTYRDRDNYLQCVRRLVGDAVISGLGRTLTVRLGRHKAHVGAFPISIDYREFAHQAALAETREERDLLRREFGDRHVVLGVDRLDYTKGIPHRLRAYKRVLERYPELHREITLVQVVVPSREQISEYSGLKNEIDQLVGEINGNFSQVGWTPIVHLFRSLNRTELVGLYQAADTLLVTSLKDGMNLVAKEFCAANQNEDGAVILSEFAGAASQLSRGALLVNPYDIEGVAGAVYEAFRMTADERRVRMKKLRKNIKTQDVYWWVDAFLKSSEEVMRLPEPA